MSLSVRLPELPDGIGRADPPTIGEHCGFEIYPMPCFVRFSSPDPAAAAAWYVERLGFGVMYVAPEVEGVPVMVHLRRRKYQDILLVRGPAEGGGSVVLDATGELDALAQRSGGEAVATPWGPRELRLVDPIGNRIVLYAAPERPTGTIDEAMQRAVDRMSR